MDIVPVLANETALGARPGVYDDTEKIVYEGNEVTYASENLPDSKDDTSVPPVDDEKTDDTYNQEGVIIRTGLDAANYLLPLRDDGDPTVTLRSLVLGSLMAAFQASMNQIYDFKPTSAAISGSFIVLIIFFLGRGWAALLPKGDRLEARWRAEGGSGRRPFWLILATLVNPHSFGLKEHAIAAITASSASNASSSIQVFTVQNLFYTNRLNAATVILAILSIGLFGYGLTGLLRPITVYSVESVYWSNIPVVKTLQSLHWDDARSSKPLRVFWYCFGGMAIYEVIPGYMFPWLNSVSIPCLASMHATGSKAETLTNIFGGSLSNEGLGILNFSFDWQYITSAATSLPLILQGNQAIGLIICYIAFIGVYYGNAWNALAQPFLATTLRTATGGKYPSSQVFVDGILDPAALAQHGLPHLAGNYAWAMMTGNAAIGALIAHCALFWRKDIAKTLRSARQGQHEDRHHAAIIKYKEAHWSWYAGILVGSFVLGMIVVTKEDITLPAWAYVVSLILGILVAPFSTMLYARFGTSVATNSLMKMLAGVIIPGRPLGNLYFTSWSHSVVAQSLNLASDLKMGEYLKIPPQVMFLTQVWGTVLGAFINYVVMISIVNTHRDLLTDTNGSYAWSGQLFQSLQTQATTWALARELYTTGGEYVLVPIGLAIGAALVVIHYVFAHYIPRIRSFSVPDLNLPTVLSYSGWLGYNQTQSCVVESTILAGFFFQYYLRNFRPRFFKDYSYLVMAGLDGGSLMTIFILSFAVFGAGGNAVPFPTWWGNPAGYPDHCPSSD